MRPDVLAAIILGAAAPIGVLAYLSRWRVIRVARRAADLKLNRPARRPRPARGKVEPPRRATLDWLRPSLADREPSAPDGPPDGGQVPGVLSRVCLLCGYHNRVGAFYCARCNARMHR